MPVADAGACQAGNERPSFVSVRKVNRQDIEAENGDAALVDSHTAQARAATTKCLSPLAECQQKQAMPNATAAKKHCVVLLELPFSTLPSGRMEQFMSVEQAICYRYSYGFGTAIQPACNPFDYELAVRPACQLFS
ncbi:unnamed protein product [Symbiodinium sp. KB8]|nr:unnamed protein product [Symbiodinium sp. KB8]